MLAARLNRTETSVVSESMQAANVMIFAHLDTLGG